MEKGYNGNLNHGRGHSGNCRSVDKSGHIVGGGSGSGPTGSGSENKHHRTSAVIMGDKTKKY